MLHFSLIRFFGKIGITFVIGKVEVSTKPFVD